MSAPPPDTAPRAEPPPPLRAALAWHHQCEARLVAIGLRQGMAWALDAEGVAVRVDAAGRVASRVEHFVRPCGAALLPGGWLVLLEDAVLRFDERGRQVWRAEVLSARSACPAWEGVAVGLARGPLLVLGPGGAERRRVALQHAGSLLASCSAGRRVLVAETSGHLTLVGPEGVEWTHATGHATSGIAGSSTDAFAVACGDAGVLIGTAGGTFTGVVAPGPAVRHVALSPEAGHLLCADADGVLSHVDLRTGWSAWRERRAQSPGPLALGPGGRAALVVLGGVALEALAFETGGRGDRLEPVTGGGAPAPWREPDATVPDLPADGHVTLAPNGAVLAILDPRWEQARLHDAAGRAVGVVRDLGPGVRLAFSADGRELLLHAAECLVRVDRATGARTLVRGTFRHVLPVRAGILATAVAPSRLVRLGADGRAEETPLPAAPVALAASADGETIAVALDDGTVAGWGGRDRAPWRRWHRERAGSLAVAGRITWLLEDGVRLAAVGPGGATRAELVLGEPGRLEAHGDDAFARLAGAFLALDPDGGARPVGPRVTTGEALLARTSRGELRVVVLDGRVASCHDAGGALAWRCEAAELLSTTDAASAGGMLALRAGRSLLLFALDAGGSDAAARASFLEP